METNEYYSTAAALDATYALEPASSTYALGLQWMSGQIVSPTDYRSRRIIALRRTGLDATSELESLLLYRNANGSWGATEGFDSNVVDILDTALALQALKAANYPDTTVLYQAINYLTTNQNTDGGWAFVPSTGSGQAPGGPSNAYVTAIVLRTLSSYDGIFNIQDSRNKASAYLLTKQNPDGGFGSSPSNVYETALSIISLIESEQSPIQPLQNAINYLISTQLSNGSWNDDPYSTALALQALAKVKPNLTITKNDIILSNSMPTVEETITITANVRNTGLDTANNIIVNFLPPYQADPLILLDIMSDLTYTVR